MVVDDIVVVGARPVHDDYIACGKVVLCADRGHRGGIARACADTGTALVGGGRPSIRVPRTGRLRRRRGANGAVEADAGLGRTAFVTATWWSPPGGVGCAADGFSLVRRLVTSRGIGYLDRSDELGGFGEGLLEPTRLYTKPLLAGHRRGCRFGRARPQPRDRGALCAASLARGRSVRGWSWIAGTWNPQPCSACSP